ncbi:hypothetical protein EDD75_0290 [Thermodesulfitimonas autotrophica]|uniref:Apea-like HEPN domain-containing protein n=1 Tax=Thermodesulfitimonas autotrophica TaxID=1894989 RepID=A0A3N5AWW3_9THEO|nr:hypothetical protein [Thermodesulfitimonas autotrophica]RPF49474.1 hypothetical protein EDD75_0290 [Thermodesulfitimonas autotrophica]
MEGLDILLIMSSPGEKFPEEMRDEPFLVFERADGERFHRLWYITTRARKAGEYSVFTVIAKNFSTIMESCEPAGYNFKIASYLDNLSGAFILENPAIEHEKGHVWKKPLWKELHPLEICLFLSRLVYPTATNLKYASRCIIQGNQLVRVMPARYYGWLTEAYLPVSQAKILGRRTWYTAEEISTLGKILGNFLERELPERLQRSLWSYVYGFSSDDLTVRWHFIAQAFQSMACINDYCVRQQFLHRIPKIAKDIGIELESKEVEKIWGYRNTVDHGRLIVKATEKELGLLEKAEEVIAKVIKQAFLDEKFALRWENEESLQKCFPVII